MAGLVHRIKEKVHRRSDSASSATASIPDSPSSPDGYRSKPRVSTEHPAFHVTSTGGVRKSLEGSQDPYQVAYANSNARDQHKSIAASGNRGAGPGQASNEKELGKNELLPTSGNSHNNSTSREEQQAIVDDIVPGREFSKNAVTDSLGRHDHSNAQAHAFVPPRKPLNSGSTSEVRGQSGTGYKQQHNGLPTETGLQQSPQRVSIRRVVDGQGSSGQPPTSADAGLVHPPRTDSVVSKKVSAKPANDISHDKNLDEGASGTARAKPLPRLPSAHQGNDGHLALDAQLAEAYLSTDVERHMAEKAKAKALDSGHLKLPSGFNLHNTEETHVTEEQRPAVVHETIIKQRTEVVQEEVTRDIHIHHYYTYLQPIRVVEILPTRHFFLDLETGVKTEVLPPADYELPLNMTPVSPDTSMIKATTRHYLVDEEHPTGVLEPPPLKHEHSHEDLRQKAQVQQM